MPDKWRIMNLLSFIVLRVILMERGVNRVHYSELMYSAMNSRMLEHERNKALRAHDFFDFSIRVFNPPEMKCWKMVFEVQVSQKEVSTQVSSLDYDLRQVCGLRYRRRKKMVVQTTKKKKRIIFETRITITIIDTPTERDFGQSFPNRVQTQTCG